MPRARNGKCSEGLQTYDGYSGYRTHQELCLYLKVEEEVACISSLILHIYVVEIVYDF